MARKKKTTAPKAENTKLEASTVKFPPEAPVIEEVETKTSNLDLLKNKGFKVGKTETDKLTKAALKFFQKTNGLKITSKFDKETLEKLKG